MLREQTKALVRAIELTPYSRDEYNIAWKPTSDPVERARRYYVRSWQCWGGNKRGSSWRFQSTRKRGRSVVDDWNTTDHLYAIAARLKEAQIENDEAIEIIKRYDAPRTLFYLDPPYLSLTRSDRWRSVAYSKEVGIDYHRRLLIAIKKLDGMAIISGYESALYDQELAGWEKHKKKATTTNANHQKIEVLWLSPNTVQERRRLPLFASLE